MIQSKGDKNIIPDRLKISLISGDIFIRLFFKEETKEKIDSELASILQNS